MYVMFALLMLLGLYLFFAARVGDAAEAKGRSGFAWTWIAVAFGVIIPAVIVACWKPEQPMLPGRH